MRAGGRLQHKDEVMPAGGVSASIAWRLSKPLQQVAAEVKASSMLSSCCCNIQSSRGCTWVPKMVPLLDVQPGAASPCTAAAAGSLPPGRCSAVMGRHIDGTRELAPTALRLQPGPILHGASWPAPRAAKLVWDRCILSGTLQWVRIVVRTNLTTSSISRARREDERPSLRPCGYWRLGVSPRTGPRG
jgi:hypothetical protein